MIRLIFFAAIPPILIVLVWKDAPQAAILAGWALGAGILASDGGVAPSSSNAPTAASG